MYDQFDNKIDDEIDYQNDEHWKNDDPADQMIYQFPNIIRYNCNCHVD